MSCKCVHKCDVIHLYICRRSILFTGSHYPLQKCHQYRGPVTSLVFMHRKITDNTLYNNILLISLFGFFVCLGIIITLENFSLIWTRHPYRWRVANWTYARHAWPLSSEGSTPLWEGASFYNGHLQRPVTHTYCSALSSGNDTLLVFRIYVCRGWVSKTQPSFCGANSIAHCATAAVSTDWGNAHIWFTRKYTNFKQNILMYRKFEIFVIFPVFETIVIFD